MHTRRPSRRSIFTPHLARLEPADRELVVLKHLDGWTYEELAVRLAIPRGTVMSRLFSARRKLLTLLGGE